MEELKMKLFLTFESEKGEGDKYDSAHPPAYSKMMTCQNPITQIENVYTVLVISTSHVNQDIWPFC